MAFHLGRPIAALGVVALVTGAAVLLRPAPRRADLTVWTFAESHARQYQPIAADYQQRTGRSVDVHLVNHRALSVRLNSLFMSGRTDADVPDAVEIGLEQIGKYLRPPAREVGFLPLNDYLANSGFREIASLEAPGQAGWNARLASDGRIYTHDGTQWRHNPARQKPDAWIDRILPSRLGPWSKDGVIFGVPRDVHPVTLTYRDDLFRAAGIDLSQAKTWAEFHEMCLRFQAHWKDPANWESGPHGGPYAGPHSEPHARHAMELRRSNGDYLMLMLQQRGVNIVDEHDAVRVADPKVAETVAFYAQLMAGERKVAGEASGGVALLARDLAQGYVCAVFTPDWMLDDLRPYAAGLEGKLRMMPLPRFEPADAPTSSWGGTMIGIPRNAKNADESWRLIESLYLSEPALEARRRTSVLPPLPEAWHHPAYRTPDPLFGGQSPGALYAELAPQVPPRRVTPVSEVAQAALTVMVMNRAIAHVEEQGPAGLMPAIQQWLRDAESEIRMRVEHGKFEDASAGGPGG